MLESVFIIAIIGVFLALAIRRPPTDFQAPKTKPFTPATLQNYVKVESVFVNAAERTFFQMLETRLPQGYKVQAKVRLVDIVRVAPSVKVPRLIWQLRGRIKSRHVDFLIINLIGTPMAVIELDGTSHTVKTSVSDAFKDGIFAATNMPFYRICVGEDFARHIEIICKTLPRRKF